VRKLKGKKDSRVDQRFSRWWLAKPQEPQIPEEWSAGKPESQFRNELAHSLLVSLNCNKTQSRRIGPGLLHSCHFHFSQYQSPPDMTRLV
jgi:hypothetical protein